MMTYRRLGRTNLQVSAVGFGTCQLRLVPEGQAIRTLVRGFELGVNLVHTAPDYEGADDLVARAVKEAPGPVLVCSQGYGPLPQFERQFESLCDKLGKARLELFGIACVEDREVLGENVWGPGGMVEFLLRKKADGRLGGIFCTTHGSPARLRKLIETDIFDALMVAYNPLGFHLLSWKPPEGRELEDLRATREEVFPLAVRRDVGLMVMKPLAGGLLCAGKAFPPRGPHAGARAGLTAGEVLRSILTNSEVACVVPGTASPEEAEENARAGHAASPLPPAQVADVQARVRSLDAALCSRCGGCEPSCSQKLPVSWLFRAGYVSLHPSETFETPDEYDYFRLQPEGEATCSSCPVVTCSCPAGLDIPGGLTRIHGQMRELMEQRLVPPPPARQHVFAADEPARARARAIVQDVPRALAPGASAVCRLYLENAGPTPWRCDDTGLAVHLDGQRQHVVRLRDDVAPGGRGHFVFELTAPSAPGPHALDFSLVDPGEAGLAPFPLRALNMTLTVEPGTGFSPNDLEGAPAYGANYLHHNFPRRAPVGSMQTFWLTLENRGSKAWRRAPADGSSIDLAVFLDGALHTSLPLPEDEVRPGERVTLFWTARLPTAIGRHQFAFDLVEQNVTLFSHQGVAPLIVPFETIARTASGALLDVALERNTWFFMPSQGVSFSGEGQPYPLFARRARGYWITDVEGRHYVDYVMGWGCALLGYAPARVQRAIRRATASAAVLTLTHELEMEVSEALCQVVPCAEMVLFGKNGSDVCTAAVRLARVFTRRHKVLVCGYHGWQDWFVEKDGFASTGVPSRPEPLVFPFPVNDLATLARLFHEHRGQVAAVMLEPAGAVEGLNGPLRDVSPEFLREAAALARREGALLIFDEIITGFRYPGGGIQKATGVVPDLACFGKALSAGMPLSALVGRKEVFQAAIGKIYYGPTFKGGVYSFAAAKEALALYRRHDVPGHVWKYGERLKQGVNALCRKVGAPAELIGPPFRMVLAFRETDERRLPLLRTLVQQELVKRGVLTYRGFMLPSYAHDERAMKHTLRAFEHALGVLVQALKQDALARYLEVPPLL